MLMGCICSKGIESDEQNASQRVKSHRYSKRFAISSKKDEILVPDSNGCSSSYVGRERLISDEDNAINPIPRLLNEVDKKVEEVANRAHRRNITDPQNSSLIIEDNHDLRIPNVPNGFRRELEVAGWPPWLMAVAKEAVEGWLPRREDSFQRLNKIGQGTYSNVYKARDLETGKIVALKKVRFVNMDPESVRFMAREIYILRKLDHPNIVKLEGLIASKFSNSLYLVLEYMEHDLAGLAATPGINFSEPQIKCYMQQLLSGLQHCHNHGVLHRDIKGSNLLINNDGILKITDFGLATFYNPKHKQPLTSRVVTLWYRPPELLMGATEYGVSVDLWSTGCILAELLVGKPIMPGKTEVEQLHKIFKLCGTPTESYWAKYKLPHAMIFKVPLPCRLRDSFRDFPPTTVKLVETLLAIDPEDRGTASSALKSDFFTTKPLACEPSSLPKYPPTKELDAKLRDEEARRQRAAAIKDNGRQGTREHNVLPGGEANVVPKNQMQDHKMMDERRKAHGFAVSASGRNTENGMARPTKVKDDEPRAFPYHTSTNMSRSQRSEFGTQARYSSQDRSGILPNFSGPLGRLDIQHEKSKHQHWPERRNGSRYPVDAGDASASHNLLDVPSSSSQKKNERLRISDSSSTTGYNSKKSMIHFSGPLMPPGGNLDEILKEHDRQIQQAVRRSRLDKVKTKGSADPALSESLLFGGTNR